MDQVPQVSPSESGVVEEPPKSKDKGNNGKGVLVDMVPITQVVCSSEGLRDGTSYVPTSIM